MGSPDPKRRFEEIYTVHYPDLLAYVRRRTDSPDDAADALAETFTTAWRRLDDVPEGHDARLWLYGVARRVLANDRRAETRRTELAVRLRTELAVWAGESAGRGVEDDPGGVREAFRRLGPDDRELLSLVSWKGLDSAEIATVLGCSRGAVRLRLHRAPGSCSTRSPPPRPPHPLTACGSPSPSAAGPSCRRSSRRRSREWWRAGRSPARWGPLRPPPPWINSPSAPCCRSRSGRGSGAGRPGPGPLVRVVVRRSR
ncbi:sigma-70 family RNA polymerase sigma factor [Planomonospora sp. ID67723]|uniref:RNA polymerase sigma factor n=1 Tax=Planomonospora sp. ID67723 TaxID=2738134 RepID=UPI0027DCE1D7|nr:sigma-70 family RNA polymerase sigma factor [Planomonospora sp. ID67723]